MSDGVFINLYEKKPFDPVGLLLQSEIGDVPVSHATLEIDGLEWTTGAKWGWNGPLYGPVDPETYQKGRKIWVCQFVQPLNEMEKAYLASSCLSLTGAPYGFRTLIRLMLAKRKGEFVAKLGEKPVRVCHAPICSEAVVYHAWQIGRPLCKKIGKLEPRVCTPGNLWESAVYDDVIRIVQIIDAETTGVLM